MRRPLGPNSHCAIARGVDLLADRWTLLIVREAFFDSTRFSQFREDLGIAPDVLTDRLTRLVDEGVMERRAYRDAGSRERQEYVLTDSGRRLHAVIASLAQWGVAGRPRVGGTTPAYTDAETGEPVELAFVTADGRRVSPSDLAVEQGIPA